MPADTRTLAEFLANMPVTADYMESLRAEHERVGNEPATTGGNGYYRELCSAMARREAMEDVTGAEMLAAWRAVEPLRANRVPEQNTVSYTVLSVPTESDEENLESEQSVYTCAICGEEHNEDENASEMVCDEDGDHVRASSDCASEASEYNNVDYRTRPEIHAGVSRFHEDQCVRAEDTDNTASSEYASNYWYRSENGWYQSYENSAEYEQEQENERESGDMYEYDMDVLDVHGWPDATPHDSLCFGVELECESANEDAAELTTALGGRDGDGASYILKSDGSLDFGAEIVTLPYTLDYHQARFDWAKKLKPAQPIANSGNGTTSCGIHVHINRAAISPLTLGKMLVFVNDPRNIKAICGIAQRSASSWAQFHSKKLTDGKARQGGEKYQALNVKENTVEVRIFKGNLNPDRVLKNLEFCHALVMYCRTASMQHLTWEQFWQWLRAVPANRKQYARLIDFAHELLHTDTSQTDKDI